MSLAINIDALVNRRCARCPVRHHAICRALNGSELLQLSEIMIHHKIPKGQLIWSEGQEFKEYAIIISGVIKLFKLLPDGRQQIIGLLFASDFLGQAFEKTSHNFAEAATDVVLCGFPRQKFEHFLATHQTLEHELLKKTLQDLENCRSWLLTLGRKSALEKVASFILRFVEKTEHRSCPNFEDKSENLFFVLPFGRSEIADFLGLTNETVTRCFTNLKAKNIIKEKERRIVQICDMDQLHKLTGDYF